MHGGLIRVREDGAITGEEEEGGGEEYTVGGTVYWFVFGFLFFFAGFSLIFCVCVFVRGLFSREVEEEEVC